MVDTSGWTFIFSAKAITCDGEVAEWSYLAKQLHPFQAVIWRPIDGFPSKYKVVGVNDIPKGSAIDQKIIFSVPLSERISVKVGDMIGWSSSGPGAIAFEWPPNDYATQVKFVPRTSLEVNQTIDFNTGTIQDRVYSFEVTVTQRIGN